MPIVLHCHRGIGPSVTGTALVAKDNFSARYDLDRIKGVFSRPTHSLAGQSYVGKILVFNTAKGGVASAWMLREMMERGVTPIALVFNRVNPILAQGAVAVHDDDDPERLAARVLAVEHRIYPMALALVAAGRVAVRQGRCVIAGSVPPADALIVPLP